MRKGVIVLILLVLVIPISAKEVEIQEVHEGSVKVDVVSQKAVSSGTTTYFYAGSKLIASKNGEIKYHHQNRLNSDVESKSLPFGQEIYSDGRFSFTGKELDASDLHYFGARYYDSNLGKFTSKDPIPGELAYGYVVNNPMNYVDPKGTQSDLANNEYINPDVYFENHGLNANKIGIVPMSQVSFSANNVPDALYTFGVADCLVVCGYAQTSNDNYFLWHADSMQIHRDSARAVSGIFQHLFDVAGVDNPNDDSFHMSVFVNPNFLPESRSSINKINDFFAANSFFQIDGFFLLSELDPETGVAMFGTYSQADISSSNQEVFNIESFLQEGRDNGVWLQEINRFQSGPMAHLYDKNDLLGVVPLYPGEGPIESRVMWHEFSLAKNPDHFPAEAFEKYPDLGLMFGK